MLVFVYLSHKIITPALLYGECFELGYERTAFFINFAPYQPYFIGGWRDSLLGSLGC